MKRACLSLLLIGLYLFQSHSVHAQSAPSCSFQPDGSIVCTTGGGGGSGGGGGGSDPEPTECTPGATRDETVYRPEPAQGEGVCSIWEYRVDDCSGVIVFGGTTGLGECPQAIPQPQHPCDSFSVTSGGITCNAFDWNVRARVTFPDIYLDLRPYPATLVRWPTAVRNGGMPEVFRFRWCELHSVWRRFARQSTGGRLAGSTLDPDPAACRSAVGYPAAYR